MDTPLNTQLKECSCETNHNGLISVYNDNFNFLRLKIKTRLCNTQVTAAKCNIVCFCWNWCGFKKEKKKKERSLRSQHDITAGPIVCRFTQPPISPPALPFTHWALYHSHTWKSVTSSPNTTSLLFPLALWRQQGSPLPLWSTMLWN